MEAAVVTKFDCMMWPTSCRSFRLKERADSAVCPREGSRGIRDRPERKHIFLLLPAVGRTKSARGWRERAIIRGRPFVLVANSALIERTASVRSRFHCERIFSSFLLAPADSKSKKSNELAGNNAFKIMGFAPSVQQLAPSFFLLVFHAIRNQRRNGRTVDVNQTLEIEGSPSCLPACLPACMASYEQNALTDGRVYLAGAG